MCTRLIVWAAFGAGVAGMAQTAAADGLVFQVTGMTTAATVEHQRAVIWQRPDAMELIIEPVFDWEAQAPGAWVVPFPALPQVKAGDPAFLDDLDLATAPRFVDFCFKPSCCCGLMCDATAAGSGEVTGSRDGVMVWSSGSVGALDYVVLSSSEGSKLAKWLEDNGFSLPASLASVVTDFETSGVYWFVAKVSKEKDRSLMPVSFTFAPQVAPFYPVRLTLAGMEPGGHLEVHLFTLVEDGEPLVPTSHQWKTAQKVTGFVPAHEFGSGPECSGFYEYATLDDYNSKVSEHLSNSHGFVLEAFGKVAETHASKDSFKSAAMKALLGTQTKVSRLWGKLEATGQTAKDISLANAHPGALPSDYRERFPEWCNLVGQCPGHTCPPCPTSEDALDVAESPSPDQPGFEVSLQDTAAEEPAGNGGDTSGCNAGNVGWPVNLLFALQVLLLRRRRR